MTVIDLDTISGIVVEIENETVTIIGSAAVGPPGPPGGVPFSYMGAPNGVATLDAQGFIPVGQLPSMAALDTEITNAIAALDTGLVHKTGTETITGAKTFTLATVINDALSLGFTRFNSAVLSVDTLDASNPGIVVRGRAAQTADLQRWQDSAGTILAGVNWSGGMLAQYISAPSYNGSYLILAATGLVMTNRAVGLTVLQIRGFTGQTADLQQWQDPTGATVLAKVDNTGALTAQVLRADVGSGSANGYLHLVGRAAGVSKLGQIWTDQVGNILFAPMSNFSVIMQAQSATSVPLVLKGFTSQASNLQQWQNSAGTVLVSVASSGDFAIRPGIAGTATFTLADGIITKTPGSGFEFTTGFAAAYGKIGGTGTAAAKLDVLGTSAGAVVLLVKGFTGQTANLQQWQDSAGTVLLAIGFAGDITRNTGPMKFITTGAGNYVYLNPDPASTLYLGADADTDYIAVRRRVLMTRNDPAAIGLIVRCATAQTGNLQEWQNSGGAVLAQVNAAGALFAVQVTPATVLGLGPTVGQDFIISHSPASGFRTVWNLGNRDVAFVAAGTGSLKAEAGIANVVPFIVKGYATQTADLQQWQDSTSAVMVRISADGTVRTLYVSAQNNTGAYLQANDNAGFIIYGRTTVSAVPFVVRGMAAQTGDLQQWQNSAAAVLAKITAAGDLSVRVGVAGTASILLSDGQIQKTAGSGFNLIGGFYTISDGKIGGSGIPTAQLDVINNQAISKIGLIVKGFAGQTADLTQWQDSAGAVVAYVTSGGVIRAAQFQGLAGSDPYVQVTSAGWVFKSNLAARIPLTIKGEASQSSDLQQWQDSAGTVLMMIAATGNIVAPNTKGLYLNMVSGNQGYITGSPINDVDIRGGISGVRILNNSGSTTLIDITDAGVMTIIDPSKLLINYPTNYVYNTPAGSASPVFSLMPMSRYIWHDLLAFGRWWNDPVFETFDGATWGAATLDTNLFAQLENQAITIIDGTTKTAARWTWTSGNVAYSYVEWWLINVTYSAPTSTKNFLIESSVDGVTWTTRHTSTGNTAVAVPVFLAMSSNSGDTWMRLTITVTNAQPLLLSCIRALSDRWGNQGGGGEYTLPYSWDKNQHIAIAVGSVSPTASAMLYVKAGSAATSGVYVRGVASQTANLQEWQNSASTVLAKVAADGSVSVTYLSDLTNTGPYFAPTSTNMLLLNRTAISNVPLIVKGMAAQTGNLQQWQDSTGAVLVRLCADGVIQGVRFDGDVLSGYIADPTATGPYLAMGASGAMIINRTAIANVAFVVRAMAAQTGDLQQWQDSSGIVKASIGSSGAFKGSYIGSVTSNPLILQNFAGQYLHLEGSPGDNIYVGQTGDTGVFNSRRTITLSDGKNITYGTVTGTKFGGGPTEKQAWWGATPVVQPAGIIDADGSLADITTKFNALIAKMETVGMLAVV